jgi:hypothetical protein
MMKSEPKVVASFASGLRTFVRALLVVAAASAVLSLSACSFLLPSIGNTLNSELRPHELEGIAVVDFDELFPGEWTELVFVCRGAAQDEMEAALGFEWRDTPGLENAGFGALAILSNVEKVVDHYSFGQNDFEEDLYVGPCTPNAFTSDDSPSTIAAKAGPEGLKIVSIEREIAQVEFTYSPSPNDWWYISEAEFTRLRDGG